MTDQPTKADLIRVDRRLAPFFSPTESAPPFKASRLTVETKDPAIVRPFIAAWHSRLPKTQTGPWILGFVAQFNDTAFAAALWHNPSARTLPQDWLELRRLAVAPDAPHCTASWMLGQMRRWIATNMPEVARLISYQDTEVHTGTIYKAAGWSVGFETKARVRDRSVARRGTQRAYRSDLNQQAPAAAGKLRWEIAP